MARRLTLAPDFEPIDESVLGIHPTPETYVDDPPLATLESPVHAGTPFEEPEVREYHVEAEYRSSRIAVTDSSFVEYLKTFEAANISQETLAQMIREHIAHAVDSEDVYVQVTRPEPANKTIRTGSI